MASAEGGGDAPTTRVGGVGGATAGLRISASSGVGGAADGLRMLDALASFHDEPACTITVFGRARTLVRSRIAVIDGIGATSLLLVVGGAVAVADGGAAAPTLIGVGGGMRGF